MNFNKFVRGVFAAGVSRASRVAVLGSSKNLDVLGLPVGGLKIGTTGNEVAIGASAAELNSLVNSSRYQAGGATLTLTSANDRQVIKLDTAAGSVVTLPAATGSGVKFSFLVTVLATSNSHIIKVANASDTMIGGVIIADTDTAGAASAFMAGATSDTITLNRSTTGSVSRGEWIEVEDVAANLWAVTGLISGTGAVATPFSATVA